MILDALKGSDEPLCTDDLVRLTGVKRGTVYWNTTLLVREGSIRRYKGIPGIFELEEDEK